MPGDTTIYVGQHFEVRDHDQPTKYVFKGGTRVAHITGSLSSTNTRIQRFRLRAGWNLLSLAVSATNLAEQIQRSGVVASARSWNAPTGTYSPVPQVAPAGMVLWVNAATNTTLGIVGAYADPVDRQVPPGATYLASTGLEAWSPTLPPSVMAWSFDSHSPTFNPQPTWHARLTGDLSSINDLPNTFPPGHVIFVVNQAPFELEIPDAALRVRYYHQDHLGSSSVLTDADGALVEETAFYPFGIPRHEHQLRQIEEAYKFTQKERDRESGLHYFEARFTAAHLARFISPDPKYLQTATPPNDSHAINLYAYAHGNPIRFVDPTGLDFRDIDHEARRAGRDNARRDGLGVDWGRVEETVSDLIPNPITLIFGGSKANAPGFDREGRPVATYPSQSFSDQAKAIVLSVGGGKLGALAYRKLGEILAKESAAVAITAGASASTAVQPVRELTAGPLTRYGRAETLPGVTPFKQPGVDPLTKTASGMDNVDWAGATARLQGPTKDAVYRMHGTAQADAIVKNLTSKNLEMAEKIFGRDVLPGD